MKLPDGVGLTALVTAYGRAQESRREDRLFNDPFAAYFVRAALGVTDTTAGQLPRLGPASEDNPTELWKGLNTLFAGRTPFFDEQVMGASRQVVLFGAGLDCRAYRLDLPADTVVYEIDVPAVLEFKANVLAQHGFEPRVKRVPVTCDLRDDWVSQLKAAGFDPALSTTWLAEGLLMYLTVPQVDSFLAAVTNLTAPGSTFTFDYNNRLPRMTDVPMTDPADIAVAKLFVEGSVSAGDVVTPNRLASHGWLEAPRRDLNDDLRRLGRPIPILTDDTRPDPLLLLLITAAYQG
jgi:methyltransferase (TIGR00027 family)